MARLDEETVVQHDENGKRRKFHQGQEERASPLQRSPRKYKHTSHPPSNSVATGGGTASARPPQNAWFHPSHPLREDPRVTARRYNTGYDLEEDLQTRATATASSYAKHSTTSTPEPSPTGASVENGAARRLKITGKGLVEKPASPSLSSFSSSSVAVDTGAVSSVGLAGNGHGNDEQQVNYDKVIFAEQVLQPVYHSPYPSIKPPTHLSNNEGGTRSEVTATLSRRRTTTADGGERTLHGTSSRHRTTASDLTEHDHPSTRHPPRQGDVIIGERATTNLPSAYADTAEGHPDSPSKREQRRLTREDGERGNGSEDEEEDDADEFDDADEEEEEAEREKQEEKDDDYTPLDTTDPVKPARTSSLNVPDTSSTRDSQPSIFHMNNTAARHTNNAAVRPPLSVSATNGGASGHASQSQPRSLWVCDRCFKYMPIESAYVAHIKTCTVNFPPGRKVYERANWGIWEIDGREDKVESFYYYVLTDSSPKRDHVIAYFTKEKFSIDDFNLATILVFPHVQQSGFGRLLMEFSYHLTKNSPTPGTPERPLSLLGARSYESLWMAMLVRHLIKRLFEEGDKKAPRARGGSKIKKVDTYMRVWERRKAVVQRAVETDDYLNYDGESRLPGIVQQAYTGELIACTSKDLKATPEELERQEEQLPLLATITVEQLAKECNLKTDDLLCLLDALGVLEQRKLLRSPPTEPDQQTADSRARRATQTLAKQLGLQEWSTMQVCIDFELIVKIVGTWRIPAKPLLDAQCCWIEYTGGPLLKPVVAATRKNYVGY
ncbi:hypothetical protein QFC21_003079 [Naganishia friedmannii]|uniref:Uncharacterized protein n=1 Tax=Naganishia friedmannii TaxID=89922 RepID=A0ACC2VQN3_9TREE|nr:hypothetical protein QFC21_003079 [Naganishia friedmannii]